MRAKEYCCCFTGHRVISQEHIDVLNQNITDIINSLADDGVTDFITGGALGFDTLAAQKVLEIRKKNPAIRLILALPCKNQTRNWNKTDVAKYNRIMEEADEIIYVSEEYFAGCMHKRNRFMVDNSANCVFYLTATRGGTAYTVKYALGIETNMINAITKQGMA